MKRLLLLSILFFVAGVSGAESVESLIGAHLQQSESVNDNVQKDSTGALADLKAQIERSRRQWEEKVQSGELVESALLQGIPTGAMSVSILFKSITKERNMVQI